MDESRPAAGPRSRAQTQAAVAALWVQVRPTVLARLDPIEQAVLALMEDGLDEGLRTQAEREAHKLAGSAGTFGFAEASVLARQIEAAFEAGASLSAADALSLSDAAVALRRELEAEPVVAEPAAVPDGLKSCPRVLIVDADRDLCERLVSEATARGMEAEAAHTAQAALQAMKQAQPDVVVLDMKTAGRSAPRIGRARARGGEHARLVVLATDLGLSTRVAAAQLGALVFLPKPVAPARIIEVAADLCSPRENDTICRILAVDDDPVMLDAVRTLLEPHGAEVVPLGDPRRFWTTLEETLPDLLILDVDMPHHDGLDLCRVVRMDVRWSRLPILFLTARATPQEVEEIYAAGADDYVTKPLVGPELWTRISNRLDRVELYRAQGGMDALTGTANRSATEHMLKRLIAAASRAGNPVAVAVVEIDGLRELNARLGRAAGDGVLHRAGQLLHSRFGGEDLVGRGSGAQFIVALPGADRWAGVDRLSDLLRRLRSETFTAPDGSAYGVTCSAGVAQYPADGADAAGVLRAAAGALAEASGPGGDRVETVQHSSTGNVRPESVDVVLVEDDEAIAELLLHALEGRGYTSCWLRDGQAAAERLVMQPRLHARLILMDVGLPGRDGLSVLRELRAAGITRDTNVVMLTARSAEADVLKALELGAVDHVAKPFSLPVLMERVRRNLEPQR